MPPQKFIIAHSKPSLSAKDRKAIDAVLSSGMVAEGNLVRRFEHRISQYLNLLGGVATSSGTDALYLALRALEIGDDDEVIIPTYVCRAVWDAVKATGALPVLSDIGEDWCMNLNTIRPWITKRTKAIIVVHTFGIMADVAPICDLGIPIIEDSCQAFGVKIGGELGRTLGKLCVLSFHATKLLTTGEGGMVLTNDEDLLKRLRGFKESKGIPSTIRYRQPMSDLQAALGLSQFARYEEFLDRRSFIADYYLTHLKGFPIKLPHHVRDRSIFFRFPVRVRGNFEKLRKLFNSEGVQVRHGVDTLLHRLFEIESKRFPMAEEYFRETLSIPIYPALKRKELEWVVKSCQHILAGKRYPKT